MEFRVEPAIFERFPGLRVAVTVAHGLDNAAARPAIAAAWLAAWRDAGEAGRRHGNAQSHPHVRPWRDRFRAIGVSPKEFPSSIEALLRRAIKGGEPFAINPLVDLYNAISLTHGVPAGGFDLADLTEPLALRLARPGDTFTALDATEPVAVPPGEVCYATGATVLTRHFVWRQARQRLITPATRSAVLLAEIPGELGPDLADAVLADLVTMVREHFDTTPTARALVEATNPLMTTATPNLLV